MRLLRCSDFPETGCCDSCHEDVAYGYELTERYMTVEGKETFVAELCCRVSEDVTDEEIAEKVMAMLAEDAGRAAPQ